MTPAEKAKCDEWLSKRAKNWQTAKRAQWKYQWRGKTLVRFLDNVSMREIEDGLVLEYLCSDDCKAKLSLYSQGVDSSWTPVSAWYEAMTNRQQVQGVFPVRLYHALKKDVDTGADGAYVVEDGCAYKVEFTFYWHQASVQTVPKSTSGVHYRIAGINRDEEDGTYNYTLEKRTRVQQDIAQYTSAENMEKRVRREEHLGVQGDESQGGLAAGCDGQGTTITRQVSKNDDCTHNVTNTVEKDKPVSAKVTEKTRGIRGTVVSVTNINQSAPLDDTNLAVGQTVRNEKTESGLWNTTSRQRQAGDVERVRVSCEKTQFRHVHTKTDSVEDDPGFSHVEEASGGVVHSKDVQRTEDGYDVQDTTRTDMPVGDASVSVERRLGAKVTTRHHRAQSSAAPTGNIGIGGSVRNEKTDSRLVDQTIVEMTPESLPRADESCEKTAHVHTHSQTDYKATDPGRANAESVSDGTIHSVRVRKTEANGFAVTEETKSAISSRTVSKSESEGVSTTRTSLRNVESVADEAPDNGVNRTVETSAQKNEFGLLDGAVSVSDYKPMQRTVQNENAFYRETVSVKENEASEQEPVRSFARGSVNNVSSNPNGHGSSSVRIITRSAKPSMKTLTWIDIEKGIGSFRKVKHRIVTFKNQEELPDVYTGTDSSEWDTAHPSFSLNEFGLYDGQYTYTKLVEAGSSSSSQGSGGMTYSGTITAHDKDGAKYNVPFTIYRNAAGVISSGFMASGAHSYANLGLHSNDTGTSGIKYGAATEVT